MAITSQAEDYDRKRLCQNRGMDDLLIIDYKLADIEDCSFVIDWRSDPDVNDSIGDQDSNWIDIGAPVVERAAVPREPESGRNIFLAQRVPASPSATFAQASVRELRSRHQQELWYVQIGRISSNRSRMHRGSPRSRTRRDVRGGFEPVCVLAATLV
jgi:hypothetical protein